MTTGAFQAGKDAGAQPFDPGIGFRIPSSNPRPPSGSFSMRWPNRHDGNLRTAPCCAAGLMPAHGDIAADLADYETPSSCRWPGSKAKPGNGCALCRRGRRLAWRSRFRDPASGGSQRLAGPFRAGNEMFRTNRPRSSCSFGSHGWRAADLSVPAFRARVGSRHWGCRIHSPRSGPPTTGSIRSGVDLILVSGLQLLALPRFHRLARPITTIWSR